MRASVIFTAAVAVLSSAVVIPKDLPDGIYLLDDRSDPVSVESLSNATVVPRDSTENRVEKAALRARSIPNPQIGCLGYKMDPNNFSLAQAGLYAWARANPGVNMQNRQVIAAVRNNAVAFMCNYAQAANVMDINEYNECNGDWDGKCGQWQAGYVWISDWAKTYGRANTGNSVCSNAPLGYKGV